MAEVKRATVDEALMNTALQWVRRSTCKRSKIGAVIAKGGRIISSGYCGSPPGAPHCIDIGCEIGPDGGCLRTIHAEANAIAWSARKGTSTEGATLYTTMSPCYSCAKLILSAGITRVVYLEEYRDTTGIQLLKERGVEVTRLGLRNAKCYVTLDVTNKSKYTREHIQEKVYQRNYAEY